MGLIFGASSVSDPGQPPGGLSDKGAHFLAYFALGASLVRALAAGRASAMTARRVAVASLLAAAYGVSDELHQYFVPERTPDLLDLVADICGGITGAAAYALTARRVAHVTARWRVPRPGG